MHLYDLIDFIAVFNLDYVFLIDSDAHSLIDISEKENAIDENILFNLWEK